jgi:hypothetical protein
VPRSGSCEPDKSETRDRSERQLKPKHDQRGQFSSLKRSNCASYQNCSSKDIATKACYEGVLRRHATKQHEGALRRRATKAHHVERPAPNVLENLMGWFISRLTRDNNSADQNQPISKPLRGLLIGRYWFAGLLPRVSRLTVQPISPSNVLSTSRSKWRKACNDVTRSAGHSRLRCAVSLLSRRSFRLLPLPLPLALPTAATPLLLLLGIGPNYRI